LERNPVGDVLLTVASNKFHAAEMEFSQSLTTTRESSYKQGLGVEISRGLAAQIDGIMNVHDASDYTTEVRIPAASIPSA
jgi:hypothetical protein